jgi:hypothetical protein
MPFCPRCNEQFEGDLTECPNCKYDFGDESSAGRDWIVVRRITDKTAADFARETLQSYNIPVVIISESGFFGNAGLPLPSIYGKGIGKYRVHVPAEFEDDAREIMEMILGEDVNFSDDEDNL